jgi:hypothetical protein
MGSLFLNTPLPPLLLLSFFFLSPCIASIVLFLEEFLVSLSLSLTGALDVHCIYLTHSFATLRHL